MTIHPGGARLGQRRFADQGLPRQRRGGTVPVGGPLDRRDRWANVLFMVGLVAIGLALIADIGLRLAAASGTLMMALMWPAEFPLARFTAAGDRPARPTPWSTTT